VLDLAAAFEEPSVSLDIFIPATICFFVAAIASLMVASRAALKWALLVFGGGILLALLFPWEVLTR